MNQYTINPYTNRPIQVGHDLYNRLKTKIPNIFAGQPIWLAPPRTGKNIYNDVYTYRQMKVREPKKSSLPVLQESLLHTRQPYLQRRLKKQIELERQGRGQGSRTRGWSADAPKRGKERRLLKEKCGDECFLQPSSYGFPICPRCLNGQCSCQVDCRGLLAAKIRARQWKYENVADVAKKLEEKFGCY
jgi:hypothetical protein